MFLDNGIIRRETIKVNVAGLGDKRQITALFCVTLDGHLLPPQLIYQGTTSMCHPNINFPDDWAITHSPNHWSTEETMLEYIVPYVEAVRENPSLLAKGLRLDE